MISKSCKAILDKIPEGRNKWGKLQKVATKLKRSDRKWKQVSENKLLVWRLYYNKVRLKIAIK